MVDSPAAAARAARDGISLEQAASILCNLQHIFDPFLTELLAAQAAAKRSAGHGD
jgi:hypothetical protein